MPRSSRISPGCRWRWRIARGTDEGWAYISFRDPAGDLKPAAAAFPKETCFNCHAEHAATDNVFTQFYPILQRSR